MKKQEKKDRKKERQTVNIAYLRDVEQPIGRNLVKKKKDLNFSRSQRTVDNETVVTIKTVNIK